MVEASAKGQRAKSALRSFPDPRLRSRRDYRSEYVTPLHVHAARIALTNDATKCG